ncbi:SRPBCC domain-containing protein [Streptomyces sp. RerS4]|uniref:SRPBCC domain-containing protein n=1 Tax=Streptomyces sp. RerS4 TaxID=2942449 RepID=UPI00201C82E0|nr:SRPBCC domain-containing protein [Streptomyces sp. RerS4]UQX01608.1 SRPBCC domain-containing protein [Streptomyces sp. RerS4]
MSPVSHATSTPHGPGRWDVRFEVHLPYAYEALWPALTTADGLRGWLAEAEVPERRLGGAVTLRRPGSRAASSGRITAWDVERVAEYTLRADDEPGAWQGRIRFHLEPVGTDSTVIRFLNERGGSDEERLDCLADWHERFERLEAVLTGHPLPPAGRRAELRASYASFSRT